MQHQEETSHK